MASEKIGISPASDAQLTVRTVLVPSGTDFKSLDKAIKSAVGLPDDGQGVFEIARGRKIEDGSIPIASFGKSPIVYSYGGARYLLRFLGTVEHDFSSSEFASRRSERITEAIRGCAERWKAAMSTPKRLDSAAMGKIASAIASSRRRALYFDPKSVGITEIPGGSAILVREKDSPFLYGCCARFAAENSIRIAPESDPKWHEEFLKEISKSKKTAKSWDACLREESMAMAAEWAGKNGFACDSQAAESPRLPCKNCGMVSEAAEERSISSPVILGGKCFYPMAMRCPVCGETSFLFMFNDGFSEDYAFRGTDRSCWQIRDAVLLKNRAESETVPEKKARMLLDAALGEYRCGRMAQAKELAVRSADILPEKSDIVMRYIGGEKSDRIETDDPILRAIGLCCSIRGETSYEKASAGRAEMESCFSDGFPDWLRWDLECDAMMSLSSTDGGQKAFSDMRETLERCLDAARQSERYQSEIAAKACAIFEISVRFAWDSLSLGDARTVIEIMCYAFSESAIDNSPARSVALFRRGILRMSEGDDEGAAEDLIGCVDALISVYGRSPVAGYRAFASMIALYLYDPGDAGLISIALNSMNAMSMTGAISEEGLAEAEDLAAKIAAVSGDYEDSRLEIKAKTNIDLGPKPEENFEPDSMMDVRFAYYLP